MAAKLLHSLTDDNPDLQKQIGCKIGIFQMLDPQHVLGNPHIRDDNLESVSNGEYTKSSSLDKYSFKNMQERQRYSGESYRPSSSSSSRSSSFSSLDCNKATHYQLESGSYDRKLFPDAPSRDPAKGLQNASPQYSRQTVDLRDLVKESIYRDNQGLSIKAQKQTTPAAIKETLKMLAKLQEPRPFLRSSSYNSKDAPRFSYDGSNAALVLKDLPRLSLDSRRSLVADSKSNFVSKSMQKDCVVEGDNQDQKEARPHPSVIAKLMGLDTLPDSVSSVDNNMNGSIDKPVQMPSPLKNSWKEPGSPRWSNSNNSIKPLTRLPNEPAPWKLNDGTRGSQRSASRSIRAPTNTPTLFPSVYSEIEKRLGDLEFTQSGKDLRALKQIMEAMKTKGHGSNFSSPDEHTERVSSLKRSVEVQKQKALSTHNQESPIVIMKPKPQGSESVDKVQGSNSGKTSKDLFLKSSRRDNASCSVNMKNNSTLRTTQTIVKSQQFSKEGSAVSVSPRMKQKKVERERRTRPPTPPDSRKSKSHSNKQQVESNSPGGRRRPKNIYPQKSDEQLSEVSTESRNSNPLENEDSAESNDIIVATLQSSSSKDAQFILSGMTVKNSTLMLSEEEAAEIGYVPPDYSSPVSVLDNAAYTHGSRPIKYTGKTLKVDVPMVNERDLNAAEHCSSPESFVSSSMEFGSTFDYNKKKLQSIDNLVQKLKRLNSSHDEARTDYIASLCETTNPDHRYISEISLTSGLLLLDLGSSLTDFQFHPSGHPINPELFLVLEQTRASSSSKQERTTKITSSERLHRKIIFDAVNEILAAKLASTGSHSEPRFRQVKPVSKVLNAQNLLKELCSDIDELQAKNLKCISSEEEEDCGWKTIFCQDPLLRSENWIHFNAEISLAVLDIERLIFKDLVDEIVHGESIAEEQGTGKVSTK